MLPAYSLPKFRTIDSDQSHLIDRQRFKPAASRRSVIRFMERRQYRVLDLQIGSSNYSRRAQNAGREARPVTPEAGVLPNFGIRTKVIL